jgi:Glyoxalase superfamily protein
MDEEVVPILRVANAAGAVAWYERLGFSKQWEHRFDPDSPWFVSIARGRARLFLSEHRGDARPDTLVGLFIKDIDAVVAEFGRPDEEPPYGCEFELREPRRQPAADKQEGNLIHLAIADPAVPGSHRCRQSPAGNARVRRTHGCEAVQGPSET